jgi:hypothetical protein
LSADTHTHTHLHSLSFTDSHHTHILPLIAVSSFPHSAALHTYVLSTLCAPSYLPSPLTTLSLSLLLYSPSLSHHIHTLPLSLSIRAAPSDSQPTTPRHISHVRLSTPLAGCDRDASRRRRITTAQRWP